MKFVTMEVKDNIALVTFQRAPINAVSHEANIEISETFEGINERDDIHCVIFRGEGKGFMSGSDTGDFDAFDDEGLKISDENGEISNLLDHTGMYVKRGGEILLKANNDGVEAIDITVRNYLRVGPYARFEDYTDGADSQRTACFFT